MGISWIFSFGTFQDLQIEAGEVLEFVVEKVFNANGVMVDPEGIAHGVAKHFPMIVAIKAGAVFAGIRVFRFQVVPEKGIDLVFAVAVDGFNLAFPEAVVVTLV